MSLPFDRILLLRDSTRAVGHVTPWHLSDDLTRLCHCHCHLPVFESVHCFDRTVETVRIQPQKCACRIVFVAVHTLSVCSFFRRWSDLGMQAPVEDDRNI